MAQGGYYATNIIYNIKNGYPPFTVNLVNSIYPSKTHTEFGTYSFTGVTDGTYYLNITDINGCNLEYEIIIEGPPPVVVEYAQDYDDATFYNYNGEPFTITVNE